MILRHPETTFIAAHMGWHANDLDRAAQMLDALPNVHVEVGAVLYELGRQPRAARNFFGVDLESSVPSQTFGTLMRHRTQVLP